MSSVRRAYTETEESVGVLVKADLDRAVLAELVEAVVERIIGSGEMDQLTPVEFQPTMSGPAFVLADVDPDDLQPALDRVGALLSERLAERGVIDLTLTAMPTVNPSGRGPGDDSLIQAWFGLRGRRPEGWKPLGWRVEAPGWRTDPADLDAGIDQLVSWALALGGDRMRMAVSSETYFVPVPVEAVLPMVRRVARQRRPPLRNSVYVWNAAGRVRRVDLHHWWGSLTAAAGTAARVADDWPTALGAMRTLITEAGPWAAYGHLTRTTRLDPSAGNGLRTAQPYRNLDDERTLVEGGTLIDGYGTMRLPRDWADRLPLEPAWSRSVLPGGDVLAEHHEPRAWYGAPRIDPDTLDAARRQLGAAVIPRTGEDLLDRLL